MSDIRMIDTKNMKISQLVSDMWAILHINTSGWRPFWILLALDEILYLDLYLDVLVVFRFFTFFIPQNLLYDTKIMQISQLVSAIWSILHIKMVVVSHFEFCMHEIRFYLYLDAFIRFLIPENILFDTKIMEISQLVVEIWAIYHIMIGSRRPFWIFCDCDISSP